MKRIKCPVECPKVKPTNPKDKACFLDCYSPKCEAVCKCRTRDYTWIQALGLKFGHHNFTLESTRTKKWDDNVDHLKLSHDGMKLLIPEGHSSEWKSTKGDIQVERTSTTNSGTVTISDLAEICVNAIPVSKEDSMTHNYQIPANDSFAHLEVQFRFFGLSSNVEGILGRTYRPDFKNPAKLGVAMLVVGGDDNYKTSSLLAADCALCVFSPNNIKDEHDSLVTEYDMLDCKGGKNGIRCKK
ncbi:hypothetical protein L1987_38468 [Smallanthus sonchifolius]|uniref:Uncharacterized protein n=1 Tax=Smallanthus sonchifolius TaxID=185202 RepID=A0ACB9HK66_9ASTR|nr:hypothetical protein L1987_38468 [Smallanthus sonchifolius]